MKQSIPTRGTGANPPNRFERLNYDLPEPDESEPNRPKTVFYRDSSKSIIAYNDSPDVGFSASFNPYRGCEHGCAYCYARPYHEYLGLSSGLDFETKIFVKEDAPELLRAELSAKKWEPQTLGVSGVTDAYQPVERRTEITRQCLQVCLDFRNPVIIVTKNNLVTRDIDVLVELARFYSRPHRPRVARHRP
jgi:DNA repair photolyase